MKPVDTLTYLFSHNLWANLRILERCAELTGEQLDGSITGTYGSIRDTLQHIVTAEQSYFSRISTGQRYPHPENAPPMTIADMVEAVRTTGAGFIEWAPKIQAGDTVQIDWDGELRDVPKSVILTQVINHGTEHRAQIMATMTQLGAEPPDLQSWQYFDEQIKQN
ncbi:MAG: DinB family protein [Anaerolineales bacterium]